MIIDKGFEIVTAFERNTTISNWVSKDEWDIPNISVETSPSGSLPAIMINMIGGRDDQYGDDEVILTDLRYQITVVSSDGTDLNVVNEVDSEMREIGFFLYNNYPLFNKETGVFQRVLLYRGRFGEAPFIMKESLSKEDDIEPLHIEQ